MEATAAQLPVDPAQPSDEPPQPSDEPAQPSDEPPPNVAEPMLWRVAVRLYRDHDLVVRDRSGTLVCDLCRQPWPCIGRRIAQLGLVGARRLSC